MGRGDVSAIGPLETTDADIARAAGINVSATVLIAALKGPGYFGTQRFNRKPRIGQIDMLSSSHL